ncbi:MAG: type II toxin-antitoxin system prevent-host-death family antitoxin [Actinomycetota bacterium]
MAQARVAFDGHGCGYKCGVNVATRRVEVGIRDLKNGLSKYIDRVRAGEEVIVTDRGRPVARLSSVDASEDRLADLVAAGVVRAPARRERHVPRRRINPDGPVSDLVAEQRR